MLVKEIRQGSGDGFGWLASGCEGRLVQGSVSRQKGPGSQGRSYSLQRVLLDFIHVMMWLLLLILLGLLCGHLHRSGAQYDG